MKHLTIIMLVILGGLFLAACGGGGGATPDESGNLTIEMSEYKFAPDNIELKVGQKVTFTLMNMGEKDHEFMVGRNVMMMDGAPSDFEHNLFEGMEPMVMKGGQMAEGMEHDDEEAMEGEEGMEHSDEGEGMEEMDHSEEGMAGMDHGFMVDMPQGSDNATVTFEVTEDMVGEWELGCFEDDGQHYDDGMKGTLVVSR